MGLLGETQADRDIAAAQTVKAAAVSLNSRRDTARMLLENQDSLTSAQQEGLSDVVSGLLAELQTASASAIARGRAASAASAPERTAERRARTASPTFEDCSDDVADAQ